MVNGSLVVKWGVVVDWLMLVVVSVETLVVAKVAWKSVGIVVVVSVSTSVVIVMGTVDFVLLLLWLLSSWLWSWFWSSLWSWLWSSLWSWSWSLVDWGVVERSLLSSSVSGGVEMSLIVVEVLSVVDWLFTSVVVSFIGVVDWVMSGVSVWVVGIVVILNPLVGVNELVLIVIESVIVLIWLEFAVFPVVREFSVIISVTWSGVVVKTVISLEVVWTGVSVEIWNVVIFINNVSIGVTVVVSPLVLPTVWLSLVSVIAVITTVFVVGSISVISWSEMAVIVLRSVSMVLWKTSLVVGCPIVTVWNGVSKWSVIMLSVSVLVGGTVVNSMLEVWVLLVVSVNLVGNSMSWVVEVSVVWTNIGIVMVIEMHLSSVVVWLEVDIVLHGVALNLMNNWVVIIVSPIGVTGIMSPDLMVIVTSMEKVMNTSIVVDISRWMMNWGSIMVTNMMVVMEGIIVSLWGIVVGMAMNVVTVVWLNVSSLVSWAAEISVITLVSTSIPVLLSCGGSSDSKSEESLGHSK